MLDYESLLDTALDVEPFAEPDEHGAASMCYTSGTTGRSRAVVYSHRALVLHSMATAMAGSFAISEPDLVLAAVPMFHANGWGLPYTAALTGAGLVFPGEHPDATTLLDLCHSEAATFTAGVPTVWLGVLDALDARPGGWNLSRLRRIVIGGAAAPEGLVRGLEERHGLPAITSWGMTEIAPVGTVGVAHHRGGGAPTGRAAPRAHEGGPAGRPARAAGPHTKRDRCRGTGRRWASWRCAGRTSRRRTIGPTACNDCFTDDGWFRTGDVASIDPMGYLEIRDRSKDLIKSGGEWISSVVLEGALMSHPAVAEAAVVAVPHPRWLERPVAAVVLRSGVTATAEELRAYLAERFPPWWLPDDTVFVAAIPRTSTGKFLKSALRDTLKTHLGAG